MENGVEISYSKIVFAVTILLIAIGICLDENEDCLLASKQARLPANIVKSFNFVSQLTNVKYWTPGVLEFEPKDNEPMGPGKHFKEVFYIPLFGELEYECAVMSYEPPRLVSFMCNNLLKTRVDIELEQSDVLTSHPTVITIRKISRRRSLFFKYLVAPLAMGLEEASVRNSLFSLQQLVNSA